MRGYGCLLESRRLTFSDAKICSIDPNNHMALEKKAKDQRTIITTNLTVNNA